MVTTNCTFILSNIYIYTYYIYYIHILYIICNICYIYYLDKIYTILYVQKYILQEVKNNSKKYSCRKIFRLQPSSDASIIISQIHYIYIYTIYI